MPGFEVKAEADALTFRATFGQAPPRVVPNGAVIERVSRPQAQELTEWTGRGPLQIVLSFCFSTFADNITPAVVAVPHTNQERVISGGIAVERYMRVLEQMQGIDDGDPEPPKLIVTGDPAGCVPHDSSHAAKRRWWLETIEVDDDKTLRNDDGRRIFVEGTLTFTEVVEDAALIKIKKKPRKSKVKKITVKKGDTLQKIANRYHVKGGWQAIAKLNKIRDPKHIHEGQKLRLP